MLRQPPAPPSERDFIIYYDCKGRNKTQREVAKNNRISQPRVSQILQRVEDFIGDEKAIRHFGIEKASYIARDLYAVVLHDFECLARDTFVEQHQMCREAHKDPALRRPPRADARLITIGMAAAKEQIDNFEQMAKVAQTIKRAKYHAEEHQRGLEKLAEQERQNALSKSESLATNSASEQELHSELSPYQEPVTEPIVTTFAPAEVAESPVAEPVVAPAAETPVVEEAKPPRRKTATWDEVFPRKPATPKKRPDMNAVRWDYQRYTPSWQKW